VVISVGNERFLSREEQNSLALGWMGLYFLSIGWAYILFDIKDHIVYEYLYLKG